MTEVEFFHHASRTLVLTDFIENFERDKLGSWWMRWLTRLGGVQDPHGSMQRDMRRTFVRQRPQLKDAVERMLAWETDRIVLDHGRWYEHDGDAALRRDVSRLDAAVRPALTTALDLRRVAVPIRRRGHY